MFNDIVITQIISVVSSLASLQGEKGEEDDRGRIGRRSSVKTCEDWNWRGKMLSKRRRTEMVGGNALPDVLSSTGRTKV